MKLRHLIASLAIGFLFISAEVASRAQQRAEPQRGAGAGQRQGARGPTAPPAITWPAPALSDGPIVLDTAIQHQIRLTVTKGFNQPWSMAFLPTGGILVTERPGRLRIVRDGILDPNPVAGIPQVQAGGLAGLMDIALHPKFNENRLVYFTYHKPAGSEAAAGNNAGFIT